MSSVLLPIVQNASVNLMHLQSYAKTETYQLDGKQPIMTGIYASIRATALDYQWTLIDKNSNACFGLVANIVAIYRMFSPLLQMGVKKLQERWQITRIDFAYLLQKVQKGIDFLLHYANPLLHVACAASYVAMLVLGHTVVGVAGLVGLALIAIKYFGYMPKLIEDILSPLEIISSFYISLATPQMILFKIMQTVTNTFNLLDYIIKNEIFHFFLPNFLTNKSIAEHIIIPEKSLASMAEIDADGKIISLRNDEVRKVIEGRDTLVLNPTSCHASEVNDILSKEEIEVLRRPENSFDNLYRRIEEKCNSLDIDKNEEGWRKIKNAVQEGRFTDARPPNFENFKKVFQSMLCSLVHEIEKQEVLASPDWEIFIDKVKTIAVTGVQCNEGWLNEIRYILQPRTKDLKWSVHYELSVLRSELINEQLRVQLNSLLTEAERSEPMLAAFIRQLIEDLGETNNTHLLGEFHKAFWAKWRSYDGQLNYEIQGRGLLTRIIHATMQSKSLEDPLIDFGDNTSAKDIMAGFRDLVNALIPIEAPFPVQVTQILLQGIDEELTEAYTLDLLVNHIYDAIKPTVRIEGDHFAYAFRKIPWETVSEWLISLDDLGLEILLKNGSYNPLFVKNEEILNKNYFYLTQEGVKLLLLHANVLQKII